MPLVEQEERYSLFLKASASRREFGLSSCGREYGCVIVTSEIWEEKHLVEELLRPATEDRRGDIVPRLFTAVDVFLSY